MALVVCTVLIFTFFFIKISLMIVNLIDNFLNHVFRFNFCLQFLALVITNGKLMKLKMSVLTYFGPVCSSFVTKTNINLNIQFLMISENCMTTFYTLIIGLVIFNEVIVDWFQFYNFWGEGPLQPTKHCTFGWKLTSAQDQV